MWGPGVAAEREGAAWGWAAGPSRWTRGCGSPLVIETLSPCEEFSSLSASENLGAQVYARSPVGHLFLKLGRRESGFCPSRDKWLF